MGGLAVDGRSLFEQVVEVGRGLAKVSCAPEVSVAELRGLFVDLGVEAVVVEDRGRPVGVVTLARLAALGPAEDELAAVEVMDCGFQAVPVGTGCFAAGVMLLRRGVEMLVVVDAEGCPVGVWPAGDAARQTELSPVALLRQVKGADSTDALCALRGPLAMLVGQALAANQPVAVVAGLVAGFNDAVTRRIATWLVEREGLVLPAGVAYLALGSQGRGEQTLRTDQDSAMVYRDDLSPGDLAVAQVFAERIAEDLARAGIPRCPGATMASQPHWRQSLSGWLRRLESWVAEPKSEAMIQFGMFQDLRVVLGDRQLGEQLDGAVLQSVRRHALFFPCMARHIDRFKPPLGLFGGIRVERHGEHRGQINLKKAGIFALTEGASLLGLEAGIASGTSWEKLTGLVGAGVLAAKDGRRYSEALDVLVSFRLRLQLEEFEAGRELTNHLAPDRLSPADLQRLREALRAVQSLQRLLHRRYSLGLVSR